MSTADHPRYDRPIAAFRPRSLNARLAAALQGSSRWFDRVGLHDAQLDALIDHLWLTVTRDTFNGWHSSPPELMTVGIGGELPSQLTAKCAAQGIDPTGSRPSSRA
jgi:hypothetical protein